MKKIALSLVVSASLCSLIANADDLNSTVQNQNLVPPVTIVETTVTDNSPNYYGYNYIGFGMETATYQESGMVRGIPYKSSATTSSPVYISGGLIKVNKKFDFSIDAASTLIATQTDEKWQNTSTGTLAQENKFDTVQSDLKFLCQYKINNNHRIAIGPNYNLFSMKRHTYSYNGEPMENISLNIENIATLNMMVGYVYEYAPFSNGGMRIKTSALYGKPIWNKATNTSSEELEFSSTKGSTIDVDGYIGFELFKGLEAGFFGRYSLKKKDEANDEKLGADTVTWPENELETFRYGVSFVWNFDTK